mmetsp:Transcript_60478/g.146057  ORF Transcript_60478/g.146057 Transcript_60478/m.146057 type:complete len:253 (-) Transcript_60478:26-784(-)
MPPQLAASSWLRQCAAAAGVAALSLAAVAAGRAYARKRGQKRKTTIQTASMPSWLRWLEESPTHYRVLMREWEDAAWRKENGWQGSDLIHGHSSAIHIPCYYYSREEKTLRGPVSFGPGSESHHGLCHGGAMTSALDDVLGHVCFLGTGHGPWSGATVQVNCKLAKPVAVGQTLLIEGKVAKQEKKKVFIEGILKDEAGTVYATMDGLSIAGAKLQKEESELELRQWRYDEVRRTVYDSGWDMEPATELMGG